MKTVNMLHYTFVKNKFGCMSQAPCYKDSAKCLCACEIKANRYIGSSSRSVKLCQWRKGNHQRLFSIHSTAGWRDLQGLIVHQLEAAEILCLCFDCSLYCGLPAFPPKWHAFTPQGTLKYNGEALGHTHTRQTHTCTNHRSTPKSTRDPDLFYPSRNNLLQESVDIKKKKIQGSWI